MPKLNLLPPEALNWMTVWSGMRGLTIGTSPQVAGRLAADGHHIFAMSADDASIAALDAIDGVIPIQARPEAMPLDPCQFDVVFTHQGFHRMDHQEALSEIARVLRPGGCLSASYVIRDDSVPWVRRFAALLRHYDPTAMRGDYGHASLEKLRHCKYFPEVEQRAFRIWHPVSLADLQRLVTQQPLHAHLDDEQRARLAAEVRALFEASVRPGERLRLPFQMLCWRAWVSHDELTAPVHAPDAGIRIRM